MRIHSKAIKAAKAIYHQLKSKGCTWAEAMRLGWRKAKAATAMQAGTVIIKFRKKSGEVTERIARAFNGTVKGAGKSNPLTLVFTSLTDAGQTRSALVGNIISVEPVNA